MKYPLVATSYEQRFPLGYTATYRLVVLNNQEQWTWELFCPTGPVCRGEGGKDLEEVSGRVERLVRGIIA